LSADRLGDGLYILLGLVFDQLDVSEDAGQEDDVRVGLFLEGEVPFFVDYHSP
jgi:hypothetical protein